jgi:hypothetical protein
MTPSLVLALLLQTQASLPSAEEVQRWLDSYYLRPRPELALPSLQVIDDTIRARKGRSLSDEASRSGLRSFYAHVFAANAQLARKAGNRLATMSEEQRVFVVDALRRCGTSACVGALPVGVDPRPPEEAVNTETISDAWGAFFATGDAKHVQKVIDLLPWADSGDFDRRLIGGSAQLSLVSAASQFSKVLAILEAEMSRVHDPTKRLLGEVISVAKGKRAPKPAKERE